MIIYLLRHGETTGDVEDRYGGDYDDHLSNKGLKQSENLSEKLDKKGIEVIYVSPRIRAIETAKIINKSLGVKLEVVDDLRERNNYGVLTGLTKSEAKTKHPKEVSELEKGIRHGVKGSEEYEPFKERVTRVFGDITKANQKTVAILTHGGVIRCIIREILTFGELEKLGDCAIIEFSKDGNKFSLIASDGVVFSRE